MRKNLFTLSAILFALFFSLQISNSQAWKCGNETNEELESPYIGSVTQNVVLVYLDFRDGRTIIGDKSPETDEELTQVQNLDAVGLMGYTESETDDGVSWLKKARKYSYADCWNRIFSVNTFLGSTHPDWQSHGRFGYPKSSGPLGCNQPPGDTAKGFGSVKEYFAECSYGNLTIQPYEIRPGMPAPYNTGIVNNITDEINGKRYIIPVKMPLTKSEYNLNGGVATFDDAVNAVNSQTSFHLTTFLNSSPNNKVIFVYAGFNPNVGGYAEMSGQKLIVREKLDPNTQTGSCRSVIDGISIICHEYGHLLGWNHTSLGNYCIMNTGSDNQNCPTHPNMLYKLQAGWVQNVKKINSNTEIETLEPSITTQNEKCGVVTIYGKAGYDDNYEHSEFFIIENRRMIWDNPDVKFDKKIVWRKDLDPQTPDGFNGGLLVIHYSPYKNLHEYPALGIQKNHVLKSASRELIADPNYPQYKIFVDDGNSRDFFGVYTTNPDPHIINLLPDNNTLSSYSLPTGITLQNISTPTGTKNINFKVQYNLGEPPNYSFVHYKSPLPSITNFSGNVFLQGILIQNTQLNIAPGTIIDEPDRNMTVTSNANIDANGMPSKKWTKN